MRPNLVKNKQFILPRCFPDPVHHAVTNSSAEPVKVEDRAALNSLSDAAVGYSAIFEVYLTSGNKYQLCLLIFKFI